MTAALARVELWTDLACIAGSSAVAVVPVQGCQTTEEIADHLVVRGATVDVPAGWSARAEVTAGRVLRLVRTDATWREYRITRVREESARGAVSLAVTAAGIEQDLVRGLEPVHVASGTSWLFTMEATSFSVSWAITNRVIAHLPSHWAVGTVTPTGIVATTLDAATPLTALRAIVASANANEGTDYVAEVRANGTTGYLIDVIDVGGSATVPSVRVGAGLQGVVRTTEIDEQTTRVVPIGTNGTWGRPVFRVTAVTANTSIEVQDIAGGIGPAQEADQFNGGYLIDDANGTHEITDTVVVDAATTRLLMTSTTNISVDDFVILVADSSRVEYKWLDRAALQATYGVRLGFLRPPTDEHTNWMYNADMGIWTSTLPDGTWTSSGETPAKILSVFRTGGHSALVSVSVTGTMTATSIPRYYAAGDQATITAWIQLTTLVANTGVIQFRDPNGVDTDFALDGSVAGLDEEDVWLAFSRTYTVSAAGTKTMWAALKPQATRPVYFDSVQFTPTAAAVPWRLGSGPATALQRANHYVELHAAPTVTYDVAVLDLYRADPDGAGVFLALSLGGDITVVDEALDLSVTPRVLRIERNELVPHDTRIRAATVARPLTRTIALAA